MKFRWRKTVAEGVAVAPARFDQDIQAGPDKAALLVANVHVAVEPIKRHPFNPFIRYERCPACGGESVVAGSRCTTCLQAEDHELHWRTL